MTIKERYLYKKAVLMNKKEVYIDAINEIENLIVCADLLDKYLLDYNISSIYNSDSSKFEKILYCYFDKYETGNLETYDFEYLAKVGFKDIILYYEGTLIRKDEVTKLLEVISTTKIYEENVFKFFKEKNRLYKLYYETKDSRILDYMLEDNITVDIFNGYAHLLNENYKEKFLDKMMKDNKVYEILNKINSRYHKDVLNGWKKYKEYLSTKDIYAIIQYKVYEEDDIQFLVTKACELMDAENIYLFLSDEYPITSELTIYQKEKLEKALKETRNIQYNFYYEYKKDKDELIRKMGGIAALILFIATNEIDLEKEMHDELCLLAEESLSNDTIVENALFKDEQKPCKVTAKRIKKQNKPCNN